MKTLSDYNREKFLNLQTDLRESRLKKAARMILQEPTGVLLDIGCGDGAFASRFQELGFTVYGIDLTPDQISIAQRRGLSARVHDLSSGTLPYPGEFFTVVFAGEVIEHLVDTTSFLKELYRVLKPGGSVILTTPNLASFENRVRLFLGMYPAWVEYRLEGGQGHVRAYTPGILKRHLRENGFHIEVHRGNWVPFIPQKFADDVRYPFLAWTGDAFPGLAMDIILKCRKPPHRPHAQTLLEPEE
jgi:2-polyprenyl-3-methyl-5-hydroxy-6-metoxy-1,4-benzoquinol methylase